MADELEEIRTARPAAFRALPPEPEAAGTIADVGPGERPRPGGAGRAR